MKKTIVTIGTLCRSTLSNTLQSLLNQTNKNFDVYLIDNANMPLELDSVRYLIKAMELNGIRVYYKYIPNEFVSSIAKIRYEQFNNPYIENYKYILTADDDMFFNYDYFDNLYEYIEKINSDFSFILTKKIDLIVDRNIKDDITLSDLNEQNIKEIYFGDTASTLFNTEYIKYIDWDFILKHLDYRFISGEDFLLTLMLSEKKKGIYFPGSQAYHMYFKNTNWSWFLHSDLNLLNSLKDSKKMNPEFLTDAFRHLGNKYEKLTNSNKWS